MQMIHVYSVCLSVFEKLNAAGTGTSNKIKSGSIPSKTGGAPGRAMERKRIVGVRNVALGRKRVVVVVGWVCRVR